MGITSSKQHNTIEDYNNVTIPRDYLLIKLASFNVNIYNSVTLNKHIDGIINYLNDNYRNKNIDILCLQNVNDYYSAYNLVKHIKIISKQNKMSFYFAPEFEEIDNGSMSTMPSNIYGKNVKSSIIKNKNRETQNIIISRYPIVSHIYVELDDDSDIDDVLGTKTMVGANISLYGNVISIYNTSLIKDIKQAGIINNVVRDKELNAIFYAINENKEMLNRDQYKHYYKTDIHFLLGNLNINEKIRMEPNIEYINLIKNYHSVDIFRCLSDLDGYTTQTKERHDYIMFLLSPSIYKDKQIMKKLSKINTNDKLINFIFKLYKFLIIDSYIRNDIHLRNISGNTPIEAVLMIYKNKH